MNSSYKYYFTFVTITSIYGFEFSLDYLYALLLTNLYYTAGEYIFHRFTFHNPTYFSGLTHAHSKHHDQPTNEKRLFIPIIVTLFNDLFFILIGYLFNFYNLLHFISASHLSYLLFEASHYASHLPSSFLYLPKRLLAFHHHHHHQPTMNFSFTTPAWDIFFKTSSSFSLYYYPLSFLPISILSFLSIQEIVVLSNLIYLYPAYYSYLNQFYFYSFYYILTCFVSMLYHTNVTNNFLHLLDYCIASGYFMISFYFYINYRMTFDPFIWFCLSLFAFLQDTNHYSHIIWHLLTAIGVGRMIK
jgi:Fatty acid hydroxylase superfamily